MKTQKAIVNPLAHLTVQQLNAVMDDYYAGVKINQILEKHGLKCALSQLRRYFPNIVYDEKCADCGVALEAERQTRSHEAGLVRGEIFCPKCGHMPHAEHCRCAKCRRQAELEALRIAELRRANLTAALDQITPVDFAALPFINKMYLGALITALRFKNGLTLHPLPHASAPLAPNPDMARQIIETLYSNGLIVADPEFSPLEAFTFDADNYPTNYAYDRVCFKVNLGHDETPARLLQMLAAGVCDAETRREALELWQILAVAECVEYLRHSLNRLHWYDFSPGKKTYIIFGVC